MHLKIVYTTAPSPCPLTKIEMLTCYVPFFGEGAAAVRKAVAAWEKFSGHKALLYVVL